MKRSKGRVAKKTRMFGRKARRHKVTPSEMIQEYAIGTKVQVVPRGEFEDFPHMRYAGRVGIVTQRKRNSYVVEIKEGGKIKKMIASPVHFKKV